MMLYDEIRNELKQKVINGKTQDEISKQVGISQSHLCHLKNGSRSIGGMTLDTLLKLFPNAQIVLNSNTSSKNTFHASNGSFAIGSNSGKIINRPVTDKAVNELADAENVIARIQEAIEDEDITDKKELATAIKYIIKSRKNAGKA